MTLYILYEKHGEEKKCIALTSDEEYVLEWHKEDYATRSWDVTEFLPWEMFSKLGPRS